MGVACDEAYATLVVRLHHTEPFKQAELFRDYAVFTTASGQVGVKIKRLADPVEFEVFREPVVTDGVVIEFCAFVHGHLLQYGQDVCRLRHFYCSNCAREVADRDSVMFKIKRYTDGLKSGLKVDKPSLFCSRCDQPVTLWDSIEAHYARADYQDRVRELQEYSKSKLQRQAAERVLIADVMSLVLQAGHEIEELPIPELGAQLKVTFKPEDMCAMVVLGPPENVRDSARAGIFVETDARGSTPTSRIVEVDALKFAPEWASRRWRVVLVVRVSKQSNDVERLIHQSDGELQWMPLTGVLAISQRVEFQGQRLDVDAVRVWKDLASRPAQPTSGVSPNPAVAPARGLALVPRDDASSAALRTPRDPRLRATETVKPAPFEWNWRDRRFDVFLSFRGDEPFDPARKKATIRTELARPVAMALRDLGFSVFFDQRTLPDAVADHPDTSIDDILQGLLSTQGGGLVVLLVSETYFTKPGTLVEMAAAHSLVKLGQVRLLIIALDLSPSTIINHDFVKDECPELAGVPIVKLSDANDGRGVRRTDAAAVRAFIVDRATHSCGPRASVGADRTTSYTNLLIAIADALEHDANALG